MQRAFCLAVAACWAISWADASETSRRPPNIVLVLADDLGWSDLGCYGADLHETPHLDQFARQAVRFTDACAMPVCSPTRATLLTGKHAARLRMTIWSEGAREGGQKNRKLRDGASLPDLPSSEVTLAKRLQAAGYLTALVGKWHLGDADHSPETHGFDVNIGGTHWGAPQTFFWPYRGVGRFGNQYRYVPHLEFGQTGEYLTDRLTDEAIRVIERAGDKPFFLYLAHHAVHTPIEAKPDDVKHFEAKLQPHLHHQHPVYAAMVKNLDENFGRLMACLQRRGADQSTIVVFASDNGGYVGFDRTDRRRVPVTNNAPLRSGKGSVYEGGIRVPLMVRWPGVTPAGATSAEPVILTDLYPTLLAAGGISADTGSPCDGFNLRPVLEKPEVTLPRDALYFHYPHYYATTTPVSAIRTRTWKLLEYFEDQHIELYDLRNDPREEHDLAAAQPQRATELRAKLDGWRREVGASLPSLNGDFRPGRSPALPSRNVP